MATRDYDFITGPETSTLPTATTPTVSSDFVSKGYVDGFLGQADYQSDAKTNYTISASVASGDLTISLKTFAGTDASISDVIGIAFRSATATSGIYTVPTVTAALSLTIPEEINFALQGSSTKRLWVYGINNAGTIKLGVSLFAYKDSLLQSSVATSTVFTVDAGTDVFTAASHGLENGDILTFETTSALPAGLTVDTPYWVTDVTTNTFKVQAAPTASSVNITTTGTGTQTFFLAGPRLISDAVYSSKAVRLLGYVEATHAGAGTGWSAVTLVSSSISNEKLQDMPRLRLSKDSGNHATSGSNLGVVFDVIEVDTHSVLGGALTNSTGYGTLFLCQIPGDYEIEASVGFLNSGTGVRRCRIIDPATIVYCESSVIPGDASSILVVRGSNVVTLAKGDKFNVDALQSSGGALNYSTSSVSNHTYLNITLIKSSV